MRGKNKYEYVIQKPESKQNTFAPDSGIHDTAVVFDHQRISRITRRYRAYMEFGRGQRAARTGI
jgi:hypothetical protein